MNKKIIFYIVLIVVILVLVFLSQQAYSRDIIKNISSYGASLLNAFNLNHPNTSSSNNSSASTNSYKLTDSPYNSSNINASPSVDSNVVSKMGLTISSLSENVVAGLKNGGAAIQNGTEQTTQKISENISTAEKNVVNYFSGISDAIQGKENNSGNSQCPPSP